MGLRGALRRKYSKRKERLGRERGIYEKEFATEYETERRKEIRKQARIAAKAAAKAPAHGRGTLRRLKSGLKKYEERRSKVARKQPLDLRTTAGTSVWGKKKKWKPVY